ncbi:MAG: hypothetical protein ACI9C4_000964 [Paraglaciecola sp.]|jgi:hypothetical protein
MGDENLIFQDVKIYITCLAVIIIIFAVDITLPLGVAGGVPYVAVILISLWSTKQSFSIYVAFICSVMVVLGYYLSPAGGEDWKVFLNRALAIFAVWVTAILVLKWKNKSEEIFAITNRATKEKEAIYLATIHSSQHIINNLLNQLQYIGGVIKNHPEFDKKDAILFDEILAEGSLLMNKLSSVENIHEESIKNSVHPGNINLND